MKLLEYRDAFRRQNRMVAHWIAVKAWAQGVDCVVIDRSHIQQLYGTVVLKKKKVEWFQEDIRPWFPYQESYYYHGSLPASVFASRLPIKDFLPEGAMVDHTRIERMKHGGPNALVLRDVLKSGDLPEIDEMVKELALYSMGISAPKRKKLSS